MKSKGTEEEMKRGKEERTRKRGKEEERKRKGKGKEEERKRKESGKERRKREEERVYLPSGATLCTDGYRMVSLWIAKVSLRKHFCTFQQKNPPYILGPIYISGLPEFWPYLNVTNKMFKMGYTSVTVNLATYGKNDWNNDDQPLEPLWVFLPPQRIESCKILLKDSD